MPHSNGPRADDADELDLSEIDPQEYDMLMRLERLESLEEEMMEMGIASLDEVRQRIADLHRQLDEEE
ncbi:MAG TPA: hypothetical protein VKC57_16955 [Ktedonobacterales bacterium]|jgi:hypothetical protein|nr:hypothetical protein [Ktedonobacterales bacterium]